MEVNHVESNPGPVVWVKGGVAMMFIKIFITIAFALSLVSVMFADERGGMLRYPLVRLVAITSSVLFCGLVLLS
jgi:hypothetical protein